MTFPWPGTTTTAKPFVVQSDRLLFRWFTDQSVGRATADSLADDLSTSNNGTTVTNDNSLFGYAFTATATFVVSSPAFVGNFVPVYSDSNIFGNKDWPSEYTTQVISGLKRATSYRFMVSARNEFQAQFFRR